MRTLWILFALFVVYATTMPFDFAEGWAGARQKLERLPLNPLIAPDTGRRASIPDAVQNVLLFLPFGALGVLASSRSRPGVRRVVAVTGLGAALSVGVETAQLFSAVRVSSIGDVVTNSVGALVGAGVTAAVRGVPRRLAADLRRRGITGTPAFYPVLVFGILLCIAEWEPFDVTLDIGTFMGKLHALRHDVWQFGGVLTDEGVELMRFGVFAWVAAAWLRSLRVSRPALTAAAAGIVGAVALEASQILITSRMPGLEDAVVHAAGAVLGASVWLAVRRPWPNGVLVPAAALATAAASAVQNFSPFHTTAAPSAFQWFPFLNYYQHTSFETVSHTIELAAIYFPLGFVVGRMARSPARGIVSSVLLGLVLAVPIEWVQRWMDGRFADVTDVLVSAGGAGLAAWVATRGPDDRSEPALLQ